jgi:polyphosphate kinase
MSYKERNISPKFFDKELGWLLFNERVLNLSESKNVPLLERLNFHNIFHSNLDEFFMKRVGKLRALMKRIEEREPFRSKVSRTYLSSLLEKVAELSHRSFENLNDELLPSLEKNNIHLTTPDSLSADQKKWLHQHFESKIFPLLTPMVVDSGHPFPLISNLSYSLGFVVKRRSKNQRYFVRVKLPPNSPLWIELPSQLKTHTFVNLLDTVLFYQQEIIPNIDVESVFSFRVIRSLEAQKKETDEEAEDLLELMAEEIRMRKYLEIVRFEYSGDMNPWAKNFLQRELSIKNEDFSKIPLALPFKKVDAPTSLKISRLKYKPFKPQVPVQLDNQKTIFENISNGDILLHHPFDSFSDSVETFLKEAAEDPQVLSIKMTLYRAGTHSPIIEALTRAALNGKSVICLVELKARMDEERNIQWAKKLEAAGVHVIYGVLDLKTHAKIIVIVRKEGENLKTYAHVGTGNYNAQTAKLYTDLGLFTADPKLSKELIKGFHYLTGMAGRSEFKQILVSPLNLKQKLLELIENERQHAHCGRPSQILIKCNNMDDVDIVKALYRASQAGSNIELVIRGFTTLYPELPRLSENIHVRSVLGRLLEHSRIYYFSDGKKDPLQGKFFIGSSDVMRRSFQDRVELVVPLLHLEARKKLWEYIEVLKSPRCKRWQMNSDGTYTLMQNSETFDVQDEWINQKT